jgi:hypothetical protein
VRGVHPGGPLPGRGPGKRHYCDPARPGLAARIGARSAGIAARTRRTGEPPAATLKRADIPAALLAKIGGDKDKALAEIVPVFGEGLIRHDLDTAAEQATEPQVCEDLVALDEALTRLAGTDAQAARLVELRYFVGLSIPEAAQTLGVSPRTADRLWAFARVRLLHEAAATCRIRKAPE